MRKLLIILAAACLIVMAGCGQKEPEGTLKETDAAEVKEAFARGDSFILVADWSGDRQSGSYIKVLQKYVASHEVTVYYIPADDLTAEYKYQDLQKDQLSGFTGTIPATYFVAAGKCAGSASGVQTGTQLEISASVINSASEAK